MAIEPVMGEGNPGLCVTREFYDEARKDYVMKMVLCYW